MKFKKLPKIIKIIIYAIAFFAISYALVASAAFIETLVTAANSDQDFAQNILGANNADNDFDSSLVTANADGSMIEITEYIIDNL